ncbi:MAG: hypothetical protein QXL15_00855 [Candidatus Korarchaeota archaeon]
MVLDFVHSGMSAWARKMGYERVMEYGKDYIMIEGSTVGALKSEIEKEDGDKLVIVNAKSRAVLSWCAAEERVIGVRLDPSVEWMEKDSRLISKPIVVLHKDLFNPRVLLSIYSHIKKNGYPLVISNATSPEEIRTPEDIVRVFELMGIAPSIARKQIYGLLELLTYTKTWSETAVRWSDALIGQKVMKFPFPQSFSINIKFDRKRYIGFIFFDKEGEIKEISPKSVIEGIKKLFGEIVICGKALLYNKALILETTHTISRMIRYAVLSYPPAGTVPCTVAISGTIKSLKKHIDSAIQRFAKLSIHSQQVQQNQLDQQQ